METETGHPVWEFERVRSWRIGMSAVTGRRPETELLDPFRFEQLRPASIIFDTAAPPVARWLLGAPVAGIAARGASAIADGPSGTCGGTTTGVDSPDASHHLDRPHPRQGGHTRIPRLLYGACATLFGCQWTPESLTSP